MGIPGFTAWLIQKYPRIVGDTQQYYYYDNLYLDMNEITYHVLHPTDGPSPVSVNEVFMEICNYVDGLFAMVQPRKLIYMAFDGVAPRAKLNEQRSRRFVSAKNACEAEMEEARLRKEFASQGKTLPAKNNSTRVYFSRMVAPGTSFMVALSNYLKTYIQYKLSYEWKDITVVLSDANVPGEGEHKIMSFIRHQKNLPGYNPNTRHCVFGSDADLILLALATHEVHFSVLRSVVVTGKEEGNGCDKTAVELKLRQYQFLHIFNLRQCLRADISNVKMDNFERRLDDFVCLCLFLGNDFLPNILCLEIWEGAIDLLLTIYKSQIVNCNMYLTEGGKPNLRNVQKILGVVAELEEDILKRRAAQYKSRVEGFISRNFDTSSDSHFPKTNQMHQNLKDMKKSLKEILHNKTDTFSDGCKMNEDKVRFGESGWKERYFEEKFMAAAEEMDVVREDVVEKYMQGICWIMRYYYEGVASWKWYYPYYYAPFASDFKDFEDFKVSFDLGHPFKPFTHMLAISPASNSVTLPREYRNLITHLDSPIKDMYPTEFEIDTDGKRYTSQGIAKLPFVDEDRLLAEVAKIEGTLTAKEVLFNTATTEMFFLPMRFANPRFTSCVPFYSSNNNYDRAQILDRFQSYIY